MDNPAWFLGVSGGTSYWNTHPISPAPCEIFCGPTIHSGPPWPAPPPAELLDCLRIGSRSTSQGHPSTNLLEWFPFTMNTGEKVSMRVLPDTVSPAASCMRFSRTAPSSCESHSSAWGRCSPRHSQHLQPGGNPPGLFAFCSEEYSTSSSSQLGTCLAWHLQSLYVWGDCFGNQKFHMDSFSVFLLSTS